MFRSGGTANRAVCDEGDSVFCRRPAMRSESSCSSPPTMTLRTPSTLYAPPVGYNSSPNKAFVRTMATAVMPNKHRSTVHTPLYPIMISCVVPAAAPPSRGKLNSSMPANVQSSHMCTRGTFLCSAPNLAARACRKLRTVW
eukprot:scaffold83396_cov55-Attheya_sp.AAC.1